MKKFSATKLAFALAVCALAPCARAQTQGVKDEAVRERRATTTTANEPKGEPESKTDAAKGEPASKGVQTNKAEPASSASAEVKDASKGGGGADELRAQMASAASPSERARLQRELAERLAESGRKSEAVELLRSMLSEERFDPPFFYNTGNALARLGESDAAVEAYRKAVAQRHGNYSRAQHNLGVVLTRLGRWDEAEEALKAALRLENYTYAEASYNLGRLYALRGEAGLAIAEWQRTLRLKPDHADAAIALARTLAEDGDPEQGLAVLDSFNARMNKSGAVAPREVAVARGEIVAATNVAADAVREKSSAYGGGTKPLAEVRGAGGVAGERGASKNMAEERGAAVERNSVAVLREARAPAKPLRPLVVGKQAYSLLMSARAARAEDRAGEAVALYRRAIEANGGYLAPADIELGYTLAGMRRNEEAAAVLLAVVQKEGARYPVAFYHLGRLYEHLGRLTEAGEAFARAAELMGDASPQFFVDLSRVREREGRYADALAAAEQYVRLARESGGVPGWANERVNSLRKKVEQNSTPPSAKN